MSPSRIPRPGGGAPPSPLGPNSEHLRSNNNGPGSGVRSTPPSTPALLPNSSGFKPNPAFIQPRSAGLNLNPAPPHQNTARAPQARRRPKPPSPDIDDGPPQPTTPGTPTPIYGQAGQSQFRRPIPPHIVGVGSPDNGNGSGLPRPSRPIMGNGSPGGYNGSPRSCLRQPSTPSLISSARSAENINANGKTRSRAVSAAADTRHVATSETDSPPTMPMLFAPSFAESREPSVPPHIRVRLRLIHQLGIVLGIDAQGISSKIDVPGLLARVDAAYDRGHQAVSMTKDGSSTSISSVTSGLPIPNRPIHEPSAGQGVKQGENKVKVDGKGVMGMFKRFGKEKVKEEQPPVTYTSSTSEGPAFGVSLNDAPPGAWCTSLIGGQKHELPLVVFTIVEEIYRRGMSQPGIFRLAGDGTRISHLTKVFNLPPLYGDSLSISSEPMHNLTGLIKRYIRDLPEPILDDSLFPAFLSFCAEPEPGSLVLPLTTRISAAQILLKLLPPLHFSLLIYLLAFLGQLPLFPDNRLNVESISIIFGPAMCASRGKGISGLGPSTSGRGVEHDPEQVSNLVNQSQTTLAWLLKNWSAISEKVLEPPFEEDGREKSEEKKKEKGSEKITLDPRLLSPIDLRRSNTGSNGNKSSAGTSATGNMTSNTTDDPSPFARNRSTTISRDRVFSLEQVSDRDERDERDDRDGGGSERDKDDPSKGVPVSSSIQVTRDDSASNTSMTVASDGTTTSSPPGGNSMTSSSSISPSSGSGIFARAFSSMSIASQAKEPDEVGTKVPKRSASFTSLSSLVRKGGALMRGDIKGRASEDRDRRTSQDGPRVNPQISSVLGSLHDLLVSKDKQIERDARELALLRHTLLEMDEKLSKLNSGDSQCCNCDNVPPPAITITSTMSTTSLANKDKELHEMQTQLTTALAALETARLQSRKQAEKMLELEAKLARADSEKRLERGKLEVALALEQAKVSGLIEERDVARDRLEKVKATLFAVT